MQIIIDEYGSSVGKTSERLVVRNKERKIVQETPSVTRLMKPALG
jgi:hypothetical protein